MKKKNIETVKQEMETILSDRAAEIEQLQDQITAEAEKIKAAEDEMLAASNKGDLKGYQAAKTRRNNAQDAEEMHQGRLNRLTQEPLISSAEYERMKADIFEEMNENTATAKKKLKDLCDQIEALSDDLRETGQEANSVLKGLQRDLYDNRDRQKTKNGTFLGFPLEYQDHFDLLGWAGRATQGEIYKKMKATEERRKFETEAPEEEAQEAETEAREA